MYNDAIFVACMYLNIIVMGCSRKDPYPPHGGNCLSLDILYKFKAFFRQPHPPLQTAEISSVGGVWIFSGTTQCCRSYH